MIKHSSGNTDNSDSKVAGILKLRQKSSSFSMNSRTANFRKRLSSNLSISGGNNSNILDVIKSKGDKVMTDFDKQ